jgi:hypothetical protein
MLNRKVIITLNKEKNILRAGSLSFMNKQDIRLS